MPPLPTRGPRLRSNHPRGGGRREYWSTDLAWWEDTWRDYSLPPPGATLSAIFAKVCHTNKGGKKWHKPNPELVGATMRESLPIATLISIGIVSISLPPVPFPSRCFIFPVAKRYGRRGLQGARGRQDWWRLRRRWRRGWCRWQRRGRRRWGTGWWCRRARRNRRWLWRVGRRRRKRW